MRRSSGAMMCLASWLLVLGVGCGFKEKFENKKIEGEFTSTSESFGEWSLEPVSCVDGTERGFEGIAFGLEPGPVKEVRIDVAQEGNNIVELHMADDEATVHRVYEPDCDDVSGSVNRSNVTINGRHMFRLTGWLSYSCSESGIAGAAEFDGCLPQTL